MERVIIKSERPNGYLGVDPGEKGAYALIRDMKTVDEIILFEDFYQVWEDLKRFKEKYNLHIALEQVHAIPSFKVVGGKRVSTGISTSAMFNFGGNFYSWQAFFVALETVPYTLVRPAEWKKGIVKPKADGKKADVSAAKRIFPSVKKEIDKKGEKTRAKDKADALLLARYAYMFYNGIPR